MPTVGDFLSNRVTALKQHVARRVTTSSSRFRLAVSSGFVIATAGFLVVGADTGFGVADSIFGVMSLSNPIGGAPQVDRQPVQSYVPQDHHSRRKWDGDVRYAHDGERRPASAGQRSMCVRLCDGLAFPVGDYHGARDRPAHEATCQSECPGAETSLFVLPRGSDTIGDARQIASGRNYSEMSAAFHYTSYVDETCSCHPSSGNRLKSILNDFTLRRGDAVMTRRGLAVFHGGTSYPYKRKDFVALASSSDVHQTRRASLREIERASLAVPATVAASAPILRPAR